MWQGHGGGHLAVDVLVLAMGYDTPFSSELLFKFRKELAPIVGVNVLAVDLAEEIVDAAFECMAVLASAAYFEWLALGWVDIAFGQHGS